jgi:hypothetical protein
MRYIFQGNKLRTDAKSDAGSFGASYTVVFDSASNPKVLIVTPLGEDGRPGDVLVLAQSGGKRPTTFAPKAPAGTPGKDKYVPGVDIVHLKKTNEALPGAK